MTDPTAAPVRGTAPPVRSGIANAIAIALVALGLLGLCYYLYDLKYPNHFVGDMYGMEVIHRVGLLFFPVIALIVGGSIVAFSRRKNISPLRSLGFGLLLAGTACVLALSLSVFQSRRLDDIRKGYPAKSVSQLIQIARDSKDMYALDALIMKRDPTAVRPLGEMLDDPNEETRMRHVAAHALGQLGGEEAKAALEKAQSRVSDADLKRAIEFALEAVVRAGSITTVPMGTR
ncbi:MAG: HEAT repeat domain-containing protein [Desulfomonile tiedjei]|nr:HEAT repeat domain-containing protein [Desulfomonile tiedjei]